MVNIQISGIVAANVRAELARSGRTQAQLAEALGISQQAVNDRLRGRTPFTLDDLGAVSAFLDLPLTAFIPAQLAPGHHNGTAA